MYKNLEKSSFHQLFSSNVLLKFYFCKGGGATCSPLMSAGGFVTFPPPPSENVGSEAMGPALQSEEGGRVSPLRTPGAAAGCPSAWPCGRRVPCARGGAVFHGVPLPRNKATSGVKYSTRIPRGGSLTCSSSCDGPPGRQARGESHSSAAPSSTARNSIGVLRF